MSSPNIGLALELIELHPGCTRRMLMQATGLDKCTLGRVIRLMKPMLLVEIEKINSKPTEHYSINPHYDQQKVAIKPFEPIEFTHHPLMTHFYGIKA